jgi:hypothetical protein
MQSRVSNNPNASVTAIAGSVTIMLVWVSGAAGLNVPAEVASAFTTIVAAVILWVGRRSRNEGVEPALAGEST